jgi:THO complex subunit 1
MPSFVKIWNLFDIISILSDDDQCDPALLWWLIEELLDSQTVAGCRKIFDYLESRREKIVSRHWPQKHLVVLRSCNELLRRLSRAEEPAFCGRVFIFLFQSFPLGDRSSVNLRGEYHTDHVTTFDQTPAREPELNADKMEVDAAADSKSTPAPSKPTDEPSSGSKGVTFSKVEPMSVEELYPIFWSLQESFNQPKKLFTATHFEGFKAGLEATMARFKLVQTEMNGRPQKVVDEDKRSTKRKRSEGEEELANTFNPKYLTSRDLFELEVCFQMSLARVFQLSSLLR